MMVAPELPPRPRRSRPLDENAMPRLLVAYLAAFVAYLALDGIFLSAIGTSLFRGTAGSIMHDGFNVPSAVLFFVINPIGLVTFALRPAFAAGQLSTALTFGALYGFFTYSPSTLPTWRC